MKRVFVLGNGATLACDKNFFKFIEWGIQQIEIQKNNKDNTIKKITKNIRDLYDSLKMKLEYLMQLKITNIDKYIQNNSLNSIAEYIFNENSFVFDIFSDRSVIEEGTIDNSLIRIFYKLQIYITYLFCLLHQNDECNPYYDFVNILRKDDIIINLNWDNLFEMAYRKIKKVEPKHIYLENQFNFKESDIHVDEDIKLIKPHGSLEYAVCKTDANENDSGCFRIIAKPNLNLEFLCDIQKREECPLCKSKIGDVFIQPYTRIERAIYSQPFIRMSIEASKSIIKQSENYEFTFIGYSFAEDNKGWIDYDLLPIFVRANKINIVACGQEDASNIKKRIEKIPLLAKKTINALGYNGFEDYVN